MDGMRFPESAGCPYGEVPNEWSSFRGEPISATSWAHQSERPLLPQRALSFFREDLTIRA